jgi:PAS domain S-box-containing protein
MSPRTISDWIHTRLFDEVPVSICVIDRDFKIVEANRRFNETYGPSEGRYCYAAYKARKEPCEECAATETFADGRVRIREAQGLVNGKELDYLVHIVPIYRDRRTIPYVIEMSTDITSVKHMEREKREAERMAAVGETVAGIAHGIKNVIMALEGGLYVFNTGLQRGENERMAKGWRMLEENIERISKFVKEFLDFAKGRKAEVSLVEPNRPAEKVAELFADKARLSGIALKVELQEGIAPAYLDEQGIHTCLANLVSNALDACKVSDRDGHYTVILSSRERDGVIEYSVADNGAGMDYDISRKIFTTFFSTKGSDKGTGLGLLTTKKIIQGHGGTISFESEPGKGSVFRIELPREALPKPNGMEL